MSMLAYDRPDRVREPADPGRAPAARRALLHWGLRLLRQEWKQRVIIVALIAVATAAMILGTNVASATPGTPNASVDGTLLHPHHPEREHPAPGGRHCQDQQGLRPGQRRRRPVAADRHRRRRRPARPEPERPVHGAAALARLRPLPDPGRPGRRHLRPRAALRCAARTCQPCQRHQTPPVAYASDTTRRS